MATVREYKVTVDIVGDAKHADIEWNSTPDRTRTTVPAIPTLAEIKSATGQNTFDRIYLSFLYQDFINLTTAPEIPDYGIDTRIGYMFDGCSSLETAPVIPTSVKNVQGTFRNCTSLHGTITVNGNLQSHLIAECFEGTVGDILLQGTSTLLFKLAETSTADNVDVIVTPSPIPTWTTPVTDRISGSRTTYEDINRLTDNVYLLGGYPSKFGYIDGDFVESREWKKIIKYTNKFANILGVSMVSDKTSYTNLNKLETIHKQYYEYINA